MVITKKNFCCIVPTNGTQETHCQCISWAFFRVICHGGGGSGGGHLFVIQVVVGVHVV